MINFSSIEDSASKTNFSKEDIREALKTMITQEDMEPAILITITPFASMKGQTLHQAAGSVSVVGFFNGIMIISSCRKKELRAYKRE